MLKVVGASWEKTRFSTMMLATVSAIAIFAIFFFDVPVYHNDGNYAATVFWSEQAGFRLIFLGQSNDPEKIKPGVARAYYRPDMTKTGWATLEIETQSQYPDWVQAHAAGLLEGSLCWQLIHWHWQNTVEYMCDDQPEFCKLAREYLLNNTESVIKEAAEKDATDPVWHQTDLFYRQLDGIEYGWKYGVTRSRKHKQIHIPHIDFLWMNAVSDLRDLELKFNVSKNLDPDDNPSAMALLKLLPDSKLKYLLAHTSGGSYNEMLRIQKKYKFGFHKTSDNRSGLVPGQDIHFTSYPASLHSQDDFYHVYMKEKVDKMIVSGSALRNYNSNLWDDVDIKNLLMGPRVMAANRLASNGEEWANILKQYNGGTGIKQWLIINPIPKQVRVWLVEQIPNLTLQCEVSDKVREQGYIASYGLPHSQEILKRINYESAAQDPDTCEFYKSIEHTFETGHLNVTDDKSLIKLMRSPQLALLGRSDLSNIKNIQSYLPYFNISKGLVQILQNVSKHCNFTEFIHEIKKANLSRELEDMINGNFLKYLKQKPMEANNINLVDSEPFFKQESKVKKSFTFYEKLRSFISASEKDEFDEIQSPNEETESASTDYQNSVLQLLQNEGILESDLTGNIDMKISSGEGPFKALAGPPFTDGSSKLRIEPFQWSKSGFNDIPHHGQADKWKFNAVESKWVWK